MKANASQSEEDPLRVLEVIPRLEVGPPRLERKRFSAPYKVIQGDKEEAFDLSYRFEEDVFDPEEPASLNLASMMAAQVALNYGLFCEEIVFRGCFDRADREFIRGMMENTACEIFVKKFLEPNPFLQDPVRHLPPIKRKSYRRAEIVFSDALPTFGDASETGKDPAQRWAVSRSRHAVLSSGGKDSLLSFGLLREMGCDTHPIFVNESGRHWFTALNAYRDFVATHPSTARVWTNADRLFAWMLRHLPFVRQDFAKIRSDEYPIRLWTVAVFLFGALPLIRKRGIGRIVIGDEFDTTRRVSHQGISHYDGLYDQSRYFDEALTRYFTRKGWGLCQFSVLRPLSELLIEKMLVQRYPKLQRNQVSCHAAHTEEGRVLPCGRCEKCRRIVGMLMALGADPSHCGYTPPQIDQCLQTLSSKGSQQVAGDVQHLAFLLAQKRLIPRPGVGSIAARKRPELMKARFDPESSPLDGIPADLRVSLYGIFLEHADGAVKKNGRLWIDYNPLTDPALGSPYPFESPDSPCASLSSTGWDARRSHATVLLGELTWPQAELRLKEVDIALLPVGALEQHGPHLPLDTDAFDADYLARRVAAECPDPKPIVLPTIPYGVSYHHASFGGTLSISPDTLSRLVYEVGISAAHHGITKLVIINGHGGNVPALQFAAQMINRDAHIFTCVETGETSAADIAALIETPNDAHAGEEETSTALAVRPELVQMDKACKFVPRFSSRYLGFSSKRRVDWYARTAKISPSGVLGDPTKASREKGERIWDLMIKALVEFVEDLKRMTLDEIHQKRY